MARNRKQKAKNKINQHTNTLLSVSNQRDGGALNFRGIGFQLIYACHRLLTELIPEFPEKSIQLEGIEDVDVMHIADTEYVQLKTSINDINASDFWNMGVLKNYLQVYRINPNSRLLFVHNSKISKGNLSELESKNLSKNCIQYWKEKFVSSRIDISGIDFENFLSKINFEKVSESNVRRLCIQELIKRFNLNEGTENQYLYALFNNAFLWSRDKAIIRLFDLEKVIQSVTDSFSKSPTNEAIKNNLIEEILFEDEGISGDLGYFDGKAARPIHIAKELPVQRKGWEVKIDESIKQFDITIIKASSGQGKSTLAWQIAKKYHDQKASIFNINICSSQAEVASIADFVKTRLKIGKQPILFFDGLSSILSNWNHLMEQVAKLPIKVVVTSREEDWYRHGLDASKFHLNFINIKLLRDEAKEVFNQLISKGKLHNSIETWEPLWEKVESKGLLIEYVYLLTKGHMLEERLQTQIKTLNKDNDSAAKIEILRLVSLADVLGVKILTKNLTKYVSDNIGFNSDRGELFKQLEKEYYLQFKNHLIEGLHPVRSSHLLDILHQTVQKEESIISLLKILESDFYYDYFLELPALLAECNKKEKIYDDLSKIVSNLKYSDMVYAIDGLMHSEPERFWRDNKDIFDNVYDNGGLEVFVSDTLPFTKLNTINNLNETMGKKYPNLQFLSGKLEELSKYDIRKYNINQSDLYLFVNSLSNHLKLKTQIIRNYEGLGFLVKWFKQLSIQFPIDLRVEESELFNLIGQIDINELSELFNYLNIVDPISYKKFIKKNKSWLIGMLKKGRLCMINSW